MTSFFIEKDCSIIFQKPSTLIKALGFHTGRATPVIKNLLSGTNF